MGNVLILTGSPRKNGNSNRMAKAFAQGAEEAGHTVKMYATASKSIGGCKACRACFSRGSACVFKDDFNELATLMMDSNALVFSTPMYWFGFPATLKAVIDKFNAFHVASVRPKISKSVLMVCGADSEKRWYSAIERTYDLMLEYQGWEDAGRLIVPKTSAVGDIDKTDALVSALKLGQAMKLD